MLTPEQRYTLLLLQQIQSSLHPPSSSIYHIAKVARIKSYLQEEIDHYVSQAQK